MIKFLKNQDIQVTSFAVAKEKEADSIFFDLLLATDETSSFPLLIPIEECSYNFNYISTQSFATISTPCAPLIENISGYLAITPISNINNPKFEVGLKMPTGSIFYPIGNQFYSSVINPTNLDGTYKGQVYTVVKKMYYNNYNNAVNIFGFDGFNINGAKLQLSDTFTQYTLNVTQSGDRIRPESVIIHNQTGDIVADFYDDGKYNLFLSGSYYINDYEFTSSNNNSIYNSGEYGLGQYLYFGSIPQ